MTRARVAELVLVAVAGGAVVAFFMGIYGASADRMPIGWDTPRYLGQAAFVAERGLGGVPEALPPPSKTLDSRAAGFPVVALTLSGLLGVSTFKLAAAAPVAAAASVALACGAFVTAALRRPAWEGAVVCLVVGLSPAVIRLMAPETYTDNLFAVALFVAALVPILTAVRGGPGMGAAAILLAAGGLAHPSFLAILLVVLGLVAAAYAPWSWRAWRRGDASAATTPTARLGMIGVAAAAIATIGLFGLLGTSPDGPELTRLELAKKIREDLPLYLFPVTIPLGLAGAAWVARGLRTRHRSSGEDRPWGPRFLLMLSLAWAIVTVAGVIVYAAGRNAPAHRFLALFLPLPILGALGVIALGRLLRGVGHRAFGVAAAILLVGGLIVLGVREYYVTLPNDRGVRWLETAKVQDAATAEAYLDAVGVAESDPVVFVVDDRGSNPLSYIPEMAYIARSILPPGRTEHVYFYVGEPDRYLAGEPTLRSSPAEYLETVDRFWPSVRRILPQRPVALLLSSYNPAYGAFVAKEPAAVVAPNVAALVGPRPSRAVAVPPIPSGPRNLVQALLLGAAALAVLALIGLGWTLAVLPGGLRPGEVLGLAPAVGIGFLILGGVVADATGVRLSGGAGAMTLGLTALVGWAAAWMLVSRRRRGAHAPG